MITERSATKALAAAGDYAAEDVLSESATAGTCWTWNKIGGAGYIVGARVEWETTGLTPLLSLYLFHTIPTSNLNDNVANTALLWADRAKRIGRIDFDALEDLGGVSESIAYPGGGHNVPLVFRTIDDGNIYGILVTRSAITGEVATNSMIITLTAEES